MTGLPTGHIAGLIHDLEATNTQIRDAAEERQFAEKLLKQAVKDGQSTGDVVMDFLILNGVVPYNTEHQPVEKAFREQVKHLRKSLVPEQVLLIVHTETQRERATGCVPTFGDQIRRANAVAILNGTDLVWDHSRGLLDFPTKEAYDGDIADRGNILALGVRTDATPGQLFFLETLLQCVSQCSRHGSAYNDWTSHDWQAHVGYDAIATYVTKLYGSEYDTVTSLIQESLGDEVAVGLRIACSRIVQK